MLHKWHITFRRRSEEGELVHCENLPLMRETNDTEQGGSHVLHGVCPATSEEEVVGKISIDNFELHLNLLSFQRDGKSLEDTIRTGLSSIKGLQCCRKLAQRQRTNSFPTGNRHDAS